MYAVRLKQAEFYSMGTGRRNDVEPEQLLVGGIEDLEVAKEIANNFVKQRPGYVVEVVEQGKEGCLYAVRREQPFLSNY